MLGSNPARRPGQVHAVLGTNHARGGVVSRQPLQARAFGPKARSPDPITLPHAACILTQSPRLVLLLNALSINGKCCANDSYLPFIHMGYRLFSLESMFEISASLSAHNWLTQRWQLSRNACSGA